MRIPLLRQLCLAFSPSFFLSLEFRFALFAALFQLFFRDRAVRLGLAGQLLVDLTHGFVELVLGVGDRHDTGYVVSHAVMIVVAVVVENEWVLTYSFR